LTLFCFPIEWPARNYEFQPKSPVVALKTLLFSAATHRGFSFETQEVMGSLTISYAEVKQVYSSIILIWYEPGVDKTHFEKSCRIRRPGRQPLCRDFFTENPLHSKGSVVWLSTLKYKNDQSVIFFSRPA
jgi:hypothetical protein